MCDTSVARDTGSTTAVRPWCAYGRPGGVSGYPRAWYRSVSLFVISNPPECILEQIRGDFSRAQIDLRKTRERELATLDEQPMSSGIAEPYARKKMKARTRGQNG